MSRAVVLDAPGRLHIANRDVPTPAVGEVLRSYATRGSLGLLQMRESARLIGSQLSIDSSPGNGTRIRLTIPVGGAPV